eukprot:CAMPEP_0183707118 /NCGR_PEP_ID=MMETSP0737-20130205/3768_1 /TAXON_ID=385413 /ORGANISM="Thalassiosira miniscula, Strain CCMP1093" /LENGTH=931 /DNA_ID=CAMNT_0025934699 /DNA_START=100 /DNA_END=2895 /DNA_ORIENTATION=+
MASYTTFDTGTTTLTNVDSISRIAFDIRDMTDHLERNEYLDARRVYTEGKYSAQYDVYGNEEDELLSLQRMATAGRDGMFDEDPTWMFQMLGMADSGQTIDEIIANHGSYADSFITELLNDFTSGTLGAQASTILVVSMYAMHQLWDGVLDCFAIKNGFDPEAETAGRVDPKQSFDNFIALYIGAGQTLGPDWDGDMLYALAQEGGDLFGTKTIDDEAFVNSDIREYYGSIQMSLLFEDWCQTEESMERIWGLSNLIISRMHIPMVQMLINSMMQDDQAPKVKMYAMALVPQLSQCRPSVHLKLKDYLLDKAYNRQDFNQILQLLQQSYDCLGFTCEDVGTYRKGTDMEVPECAGYEKEYPMASFVPKTNVREVSKADLDILTIDQLLKFPSATKNQMAQLYFKYGRGMHIIDGSDFGFISLDNLSSVSDEVAQQSPYYSEYIEYFGHDKATNTAIVAAFDDTDGDAEQRRAYLVHLMRLNMIPQHMMTNIGLSIRHCTEVDVYPDVPPSLYWDEFAALYIGSLEGGENSFNDEGLMLWNLANNRASQFRTQNNNFIATVNEEMLDLLYAGQSDLERKDCVNFETTATRALHLMLVPLVQSTIWYAILNEELSSDSTETSLVVGEAAALSVLPIVSKYDEEAAAVIERNMIRTEGIKPVVEGPQAVANAFFNIIDDIGLGCEYIGEAEGFDACEQFDSNNIGSIPLTSPQGGGTPTSPIFPVPAPPTVSPAPSTNQHYCGSSQEDAQNRCEMTIPCPEKDSIVCLRGQACYQITGPCGTIGGGTHPDTFAPMSPAPTQTVPGYPTVSPTETHIFDPNATNFCGIDYDDVVKNCYKNRVCPTGNTTECPSGQMCFPDLPNCNTPPPTMSLTPTDYVRTEDPTRAPTLPPPTSEPTFAPTQDVYFGDNGGSSCSCMSGLIMKCLVIGGLILGT